MSTRGWMIVRHWCVIAALMALVVLAALPVGAATPPQPLPPVGVNGDRRQPKSISKANDRAEAEYHDGLCPADIGEDLYVCTDNR